MFELNMCSVEQSRMIRRKKKMVVALYKNGFTYEYYIRHTSSLEKKKKNLLINKEGTGSNFCF